MIGRHNNLPIWTDGTGADTEVDEIVADDRTDCTGVDWIVEAGRDEDEDGTEDGTDEIN